MTFDGHWTRRPTRRSSARWLRLLCSGLRSALWHGIALITDEPSRPGFRFMIPREGGEPVLRPKRSRACILPAYRNTCQRRGTVCGTHDPRCFLDDAYASRSEEQPTPTTDTAKIGETTVGGAGVGRRRCPPRTLVYIASRRLRSDGPGVCASQPGRRRRRQGSRWPRWPHLWRRFSHRWWHLNGNQQPQGPLSSSAVSPSFATATSVSTLAGRSSAAIFATAS